VDIEVEDSILPTKTDWLLDFVELFGLLRYIFIHASYTYTLSIVTPALSKGSVDRKSENFENTEQWQREYRSSIVFSSHS